MAFSNTLALRYVVANAQTFPYRDLHRVFVAKALVEGGFVEAGALTDATKLRYQAVFLMGAGGSGKGFVGQRWMKYMPGGTGKESPTELAQKFNKSLSEQERGLSNLSFDSVVEKLKTKGITLEPVDAGSSAAIPFKLYREEAGQEILMTENDWPKYLPPDILSQVMGLKEVVFGTPVHELPSYWRQVNPDLYKEELMGYMETDPGYVHEMSSNMSKAYFEAILASGDPLFVDGTGSNPVKMTEQMNAAKKAGYRVSLVYVVVPLVVNQIRNATRSRNVNPTVITKQWYAIQDSFSKIRNLADKAKVVINRNDPVDIKAYTSQRQKIDGFIQRTTGKATLGEYMREASPSDFREWAPSLGWV